MPSRWANRSQPRVGILRVVLILASFCLVWICTPGVSRAAKEIRVSPTGAISTITAALRLAEPGDKILIQSGIYREGTIIVDKAVELVGIGWPEIDGEGQSQVLTVRSDSVTIRGLIIKNAGVSFIDDNAGVNLENVRHCVIEGNRFINNFFALYLATSSDCRIANNEIIGQSSRQSTSGNGIHLWYCKNIEVRNNVVRGHRDGIYFEFVEDSQVEDNLSTENLRYGLHFMFSDRCRYARNRFRRNGAGVAVMYTKRITMTGNHFDSNWGSASFGLLLKDITDSIIRDNRISGNSTGLYLEACSRNLITSNEFNRNGWAIKLMANSMDNQFTVNNFENNSFDVATNSRQNFNTFDGNYWGRYSGYDLDRDGIGDVPYRPVSLFGVLIEQNPPGLILLRSLFVEILSIAEKVIPALTPETLVDQHPRMKRLL